MRFVSFVGMTLVVGSAALAEPPTEMQLEYQPTTMEYEIPTSVIEAMSIRGITVGMSRSQVENALSALGGFERLSDSTTTADWRSSKVITESHNGDVFQVYFPNYNDRLGTMAYREHFYESFSFFFLPEASGGNLYALAWKIWSRGNPIDGTDLIKTFLDRIPSIPEDTVSETNFRGPYREFRWAFGREGAAAKSKECEAQFGRLKEPNAVSTPILIYGVGSFAELERLNVRNSNCLNVVYLDVVGKDPQIVEANFKFASVSLMAQGLSGDLPHAYEKMDALFKDHDAWKSGAKAPTP